MTTQNIIRQQLQQQQLRQGQDRNALLQRQIRERQLQQQLELQRQEQVRQERIRQQQQLSESQQQRQAQKQEALRILVEKGKGSSELYSLTPQERAEVEAIASDIKASRERQIGRMAVSQAKELILKKDPLARFGKDFERGVYQEALQRGGNVDLVITQTVPAQMLVDDAQFKYLPQQTQKEIITTPLFKPFIYPIADKVKQIYQSPTGVKIREQLSGLTFAKSQATSSNKIVYDTVKKEARFEGVQVGTPEYEKAVQNAMTGQVLSSAVLGSIAGVPKVPTTIKMPIRNINPNPFGVEFQQPVITSQGQQRTLSNYQILQERQAPSQVLKSSKDLGLLGNSDNVVITSPKYTITSTSLPVVDEGTAITLTSKGAKVGKVESIKGKSITTDSEEFLKNVQRLGISPQIKSLPESSKVSIGYLERDTLGFALPEKVKTRYQTYTITNKIRDKESYNILESTTLFKNLDKPRAKNQPALKMVIVQSKKPIILDSASDVNFINPNPNIKKTPLSVTFAKQEVIQTPKPLPEIVKTPKTQVISKSDTSKTYGNIGLLSGSVSRNSDRTSSSFSDDFSRGLQDFTKSKTKAQETPRPKLEVIDLAIPKTSTSQVSVSIPSQSTSQLNVQVPKSNVIQTPISTQPPKQTSNLINLLRSAQTQQQKQMLRTILKMRFGQNLRTPSKQPPTTSRINLPSFDINSKSDKEINKDSLGFGVEVRRRGKFLPLGKPLSSLGEALLKAQRYTDVTLARSFRLRNLDTGELVSPSSVSNIFRQSKKENKVFVERSKFALGRSEQKEISLFKKSKRRKNLFGI